MTEEPPQTKTEVAEDGEFEVLMHRTDELITQFFQLRRFIGGGEGVHVRPGIKTFIDTDT